MKLNYKAKILLSLLTVTGIIFFGALTFYFIKFRKIAYTEAIKMVDAYGRENANSIAAEFNTDMGLCRALASSVASSQAFHTEKRWEEYIGQLAEIDKNSKGYLNVWASYELAFFRKGYNKKYGRRVLNVFTNEQHQSTKDYYKNLEGDDIGSSYLKIKTNKTEAVIEPYLFSLSGKAEDEQLVTSICVPILLDNDYIGLAGVDIGLERYQLLTDKIKPYDDSYSFLVAYDGRIITHPDKELVNTTISGTFTEMDKTHHVLEKVQVGQPFSYSVSGKINEYYSFAPIIIGETNTPWALVTVTPESTIYAKARNVLKQTLLFGLIGFIILGIIIWFIITKLIVTIHKFIDFTNKVNNGNLTEEIDIQRDDELGELARALMNMTRSLRNIVNQLKISSENISEASNLLNTNSQNISYSASKQAAEVEEISSALEQMVLFIDQNAKNSKTTELIALESKSGIIDGTNASVKATQSMQEIATKNHIISDIAFQTNILALNAAVEAARAGDHGRGFSVVAVEVRKLAERSKEAANEITQLSEVILSDSENAQNKLSSVLPEIEKTTNLVQEIAASSKEQSEGVSQINISIHELNDITQDNAGSAENLAASAEELSAQADQLKELISSFKS